MLNSSITRREMLLLAAGGVSLTILGNARTAEAKTAQTKTTRAKTVRYAIIYQLDGGTNPEWQPRKIAKGKTLQVKQLAIPSKRGYKFKGWYQDAGLTVRARKILGANDKEKRTLYAKWALAKYSIEYASYGGKQTVPMPARYTMETPTFSLFALSREGRAFGGWYRDAAHTREIHEVQQGSTGELKLYAKWHRAGYWTRHLFSKCSRINTICRSASAQSVSFMFITDMHVPDNCLYSFELVDQVRERTSVKAVVCGGDSLDWSTTTKEARNILATVRTGLTRSGAAYFIRGNHDANDQGHELDGKMLSDAECRKFIFGDVGYVADDSLYYYRDDTDAKIRYFFLDTGHAKAGRLGKKQLAWLKTHLLELDSSWGVVIFMHRYYSYLKNTEQEPDEPPIDPNGVQLNRLLDRIHGQLSAEVICVISGHCHRDRSSYHAYESNGGAATGGDTAAEGAAGFLAFSTTCDAFRQARIWDDAHPIRQRGTTEEQAFDVITIDREARKIYATRIGCGSDRVFSY